MLFLNTYANLGKNKTLSHRLVKVEMQEYLKESFPIRGKLTLTNLHKTYNERHEKYKNVIKFSFDGQRRFEIPGLLASHIKPKKYKTTHTSMYKVQSQLNQNNHVNVCLFWTQEKNSRT